MLSMLIVISISYPGFRSILLDLVWKTRRASGVGEDGSLLYSTLLCASMHNISNNKVAPLSAVLPLESSGGEISTRSAPT